ncbi:hypothetical protein BC828DRAFT_405327 [Blastocladiella britannica]|nr:hypothetical protein BC828DRAFT_405327 [Blastocladiella britannica]
MHCHVKKSGAEQEDLKALQSSLGADGRSARSCELAAFHAYLMRRLEVAAALRHLYGTVSHRYRSLTQGALLAEVLSPQPKKIALLYGDWSNQPGFHGSQSTMGVCLHRVLADEFLLLRVNEFRTSRLCPMCHGPVVPQR